VAIGPDRIVMEGESPHPWERDAMTFIKKELPNGDPYLAALQVDLHGPSGTIHQIDALVLGYHALYVVEVKSHPGTLEGDYADWKFTFPDGKAVVIDNPIRDTTHKAKVLASILRRIIPDSGQCPWVEPLVLLSDPGIVVKLGENYRGGIVTRPEFLRAVSFGKVPLAEERLQRRTVNRPTMRAVAEALKKVLTPSRGGLRWGDFSMLRVIEEGAGWQDWNSEHATHRDMRRRIRVYPVPPSSTPERRDQLRRAADREARLLTVLGDHRAILKALDYQPQGPTGAPAVAFESFDEGEQLDAFLRRHPDLSFAHKVAILEQLAEALAYCHGKKVFHRGLHPGAVLVRLRPDGAPEVRLYNFQLATRADSTIGTIHLSAFSPDPALLYRAPEAIEDPARASTPEADLFSLGAVAYHVLTGRPPGADLSDRHTLLGTDGLSVAAASDALAGRADAEDVRSLDDVVRFATTPSSVNRADDVVAWLNLLLDTASRPAAAPEAEVDPLEAGKDDELAGGLQVEAVLGSGSTARVLRVRRGDQVLALKVPLSPEMEERLTAEAEALRKAKCDRVVSLDGEPTLKGRRCLLLGYAGDTLASLLTREGPPSLDYARRWGDDLLYALTVLEERGVLHRDVKPANLGVLAGESKKARHLFLFDFSLTGADPARIELGTPAYRDPFLATRPGARWDDSSDRYSAAVTLHEMLAGVMPRYGSGDAAAVATDADVTIAAERFDATVRDGLVAFFAKALDRDVGKRHTSAEEMRSHWTACFGSAAQRATEERAALDDAALAALSIDTPVPSLPLSAAAKNALDRSGVLSAREILELPRNQLSSIRGVGRTTVREILDFVDRYRKVASSTAPVVPFWPGYRGQDGEVSDALSAAPADALADAGLARLHAVAAAAKDRVERILERFPGARAMLGAHLERAQQQATGAPATAEGFLELFLPAARSRRGEAWVKHVRALYGLDALPGAVAGDARAIAAVMGVTRAAVYLSLARGREKWRARPEQLAALRAAVAQALQSLGGAASLERVGAALPTVLPHEAGQESGPAARMRMEALVRVCVETADPDADADDGSALALEQVASVPWVGLSAAHLQASRALGAVAAELARQDPLASAAETERRLAEVARETPLAELPAERLASLAAEASGSAARSARLEIYPAGMASTRALRLCAGALGADITPEDVVRLVSNRYPQAEPLPPRPELDALLAELRLSWNEERGRYVRPDLAQSPTKTEALSSRKSTVVATVARKERSPEALEADQFDQTLRLAVERRLFKVLDVNRAHAEDAADQLRARLGVEPRSLERLLLDAAWTEMREQGVDEQVVLDADREGPSGASWLNLRQLMKLAGERVAPQLLAERGPVVLKDPGLAARYQLDELLSALVAAAQDDKAPAILILNPVVDGDGAQPIDAVTGPIAIPTTAPAQRLQVPASWIQNRHRGEV